VNLRAHRVPRNSPSRTAISIHRRPPSLTDCVIFREEVVLIARHLPRKLGLDPRKVHVKFIADSGTRIGFSPRTSGFLISPMLLLTHLHLSLHSALTRKTKGRNLRPSKKKKKQRSFRNREHCKQSYFHLLCKSKS
jgi:hypothetical protein